MGVLTSVSLVPYYVKAEYLNKSIWGAAIAQWIRLRLPSCHPGFESQAHHLHFFHLYYLCYICHLKRMKINKKRPGLAHFYKGSVVVNKFRYTKLKHSDWMLPVM